MATIIWAALLAGPTMFLGVALYLFFGLRGAGLAQSPLDWRVAVGASAALSAVTVAASWLWAVRMPVTGQRGVRLRGGGALPPGPESNAVTRLIAACALCEGGALAAVVAFLLTGEQKVHRVTCTSGRGRDAAGSPRRSENAPMAASSRTALLSLATAAVLTLGVARAAPAGTARRVAVLDFNARWAGKCTGAGLTDAQEERCEALRLFADKARAGALAVLRPPAYIVMTRENTAQILKDMGGQCMDGECEVETARLLGASLVVSGEVTYMEGTWVVSLKVHDVATAALLGTGETQARSKLEASGNVRAGTEKMLREAVGLDGRFPVAPASAESPREAPPPPPPGRVEPEVAKPVSAPVEEVVKVEAVRPAEAKVAPGPAIVAPPESGTASAPPAASVEASRGSRWSMELLGGIDRLGSLRMGEGEYGSLAVAAFDLRGSYRLSRYWSAHVKVRWAGGAESSAEFSNDLTLRWDSSVGAAAGVAWTPRGNPWFSVGAEAGFMAIGAELESAAKATKENSSGVAPTFGVDVRLAWPLADAWSVGVRAGAAVMNVKLDNELVFDGGGFDQTATIKETLVSVLSARLAVGYRF